MELAPRTPLQEVHEALFAFFTGQHF